MLMSTEVSRRDFLKTTGQAAGALAFAPLADIEQIRRHAAIPQEVLSYVSAANHFVKDATITPHKMWKNVMSHFYASQDHFGTGGSGQGFGDFLHWLQFNPRPNRDKSVSRSYQFYDADAPMHRFTQAPTGMEIAKTAKAMIFEDVGGWSSESFCEYSRVGSCREHAISSLEGGEAEFAEHLAELRAIRDRVGSVYDRNFFMDLTNAPSKGMDLGRLCDRPYARAYEEVGRLPDEMREIYDRFIAGPNERMLEGYNNELLSSDDFSGFISGQAEKFLTDNFSIPSPTALTNTILDPTGRSLVRYGELQATSIQRSLAGIVPQMQTLYGNLIVRSQFIRDDRSKYEERSVEETIENNNLGSLARKLNEVIKVFSSASVPNTFSVWVNRTYTSGDGTARPANRLVNDGLSDVEILDYTKNIFSKVDGFEVVGIARKIGGEQMFLCKTDKGSDAAALLTDIEAIMTDNKMNWLEQRTADASKYAIKDKGDSPETRKKFSEAFDRNARELDLWVQPRFFDGDAKEAEFYGKCIER